MKFLLEDYGESSQLNDFVELSRTDEFGTYYRVTLKMPNSQQNRYFAYQYAAKDYYDKLVKEAKNKLNTYDGSDISLTKVILEPVEDEIESYFVDKEEEENN